MTINELIQELQNLTNEQKQKELVVVDPNGLLYNCEYSSYCDDINKFVIEIDYGISEDEE